jgi:hypothetical protein
MYVIIPCITGASKPNERLYQNDRLQYVIPSEAQFVQDYLWSPYRKVVIVLEILVAALIIYKHIVFISFTSTLIYFNTVRNKVKWAVFFSENRM